MLRTRLDFVATGRRCAHVALLMVMALGAAGGLAVSSGQAESHYRRAS
jgi:hypothetical protein